MVHRSQVAPSRAHSRSADDDAASLPRGRLSSSRMLIGLFGAPERGRQLHHRAEAPRGSVTGWRCRRMRRPARSRGWRRVRRWLGSQRRVANSRRLAAERGALIVDVADVDRRGGPPRDVVSSDQLLDAVVGAGSRAPGQVVEPMHRHRGKGAEPDHQDRLTRLPPANRRLWQSSSVFIWLGLCRIIDSMVDKKPAGFLRSNRHHTNSNRCSSSRDHGRQSRGSIVAKLMRVIAGIVLAGPVRRRCGEMPGRSVMKACPRCDHQAQPVSTRLEHDAQIINSI